MEVLAILFWYVLAGAASILLSSLVLKKKARRYYDGLSLPQLSPYLGFSVMMWWACWFLQAAATHLYLRHLQVEWTRDTTMLVVALPVSLLILPALVRLRSAVLAILLCIPALGLLLTVCVEYFKAYLPSGWFVLLSVCWLCYMIIWLFYVRLTQAPVKSTSTKKVKYMGSSLKKQRNYPASPTTTTTTTNFTLV